MFDQHHQVKPECSWKPLATNRFKEYGEKQGNKISWFPVKTPAAAVVWTKKTLNLSRRRWTELACHGNPPPPRSGHQAFAKDGPEAQGPSRPWRKFASVTAFDTPPKTCVDVLLFEKRITLKLIQNYIRRYQGSWSVVSRDMCSDFNITDSIQNARKTRYNPIPPRLCIHLWRLEQWTAIQRSLHVGHREQGPVVSVVLVDDTHFF